MTVQSADHISFMYVFELSANQNIVMCGMLLSVMSNIVLLPIETTWHWTADYNGAIGGPRFIYVCFWIIRQSRHCNVQNSQVEHSLVTTWNDVTLDRGLQRWHWRTLIIRQSLARHCNVQNSQVEHSLVTNWNDVKLDRGLQQWHRRTSIIHQSRHCNVQNIILYQVKHSLVTNWNDVKMERGLQRCNQWTMFH